MYRFKLNIYIIKNILLKLNSNKLVNLIIIIIFFISFNYLISFIIQIKITYFIIFY